MAEVVRSELRALGAEVARGRRRGDAAGRVRQHPRPLPAHRRGRRADHVRRPPRHRAGDRPDRGGGGGRPPHQPPRRHPRGRRQVGRRGAAAGDAPRGRGGAPALRGRAVFTPCEEIGLRGADAFDPSPLARRASASSTTTPARWATSSRSAPSLHRIDATFVGRAGARGHLPGEGPQRRAGRRAGDRPHATRADRRRDHRQRRHDRTAARPPTSSRSAARSPPRPAAATSGRCPVSSRRCSTPSPGPPASARSTSRRGSRRSSSPTAWARADPQVAHGPGGAVGRSATRRGSSPSGGGSDVNAFLRNGFPAVNLCNGMIDVHTRRRAHRDRAAWDRCWTSPSA